MRSLMSMFPSFKHILIFALMCFIIDFFITAARTVRDLTGRSDDE